MVTVGVVLGTFLVIAGCCCNVVFLEHLIKASPSSGNMIVFFQFLFISVEGLVFYSKFGRTKRVIPFKSYAVMVLMFFSAGVTNIMALNCNIPMPLHMIFKSGSLVANMFMGFLLLKRSYSSFKIISVVFVSTGIFICTIATTMTDSSAGSSDFEQSTYSFLTMLVGLVLLTFALLMSARLGIYQETLFKEYGKHSREALFYNHFIPLPFFIMLAPSIMENISIINQSDILPIPILSGPITFLFGDHPEVLAMISIPKLWQYLLINLFTQYMCIRSVFYLTSVCSSLTVTFIITLRKFISLVVSVLYFNNHFTFLHCVGALFVFIGTFLYVEIIPDNFRFSKRKNLFSNENNKVMHDDINAHNGSHEIKDKQS